MAEVALKGVESIEFFTPETDGSFPSSGGVKVTNIEMGSVTIDIPAIEKEKIYVEDKSGPFEILGQDGDGATLTANTLNFDPKIAELVFKGITTSSASTRFEAPTTNDIVHLAIKVTSQPHDGKQAEFKFVKAAVTPGITNPLTKDGFIAISIEAEALSVSDDDGGPVAPWFYDIKNVTPTT